MCGGRSSAVIRLSWCQLMPSSKDREHLLSKGFRDTSHFSLSFFSSGLGIDITLNTSEACQTPTFDWRGTRRGPSSGGGAPVGGKI